MQERLGKGFPPAMMGLDACIPSEGQLVSTSHCHVYILYLLKPLLNPRDMVFSNWTRHIPLKCIPNLIDNLGEWHDFLQSLELLEDADTGSSAAMALSYHWLQTCFKTHLHCRRHLTEQYSPTRVLDLQESQNLRILQHATIDHPYVALSHRWGQEKLPRTTSANLAERLGRLALHDLTQTMKDAVRITRDLGYRYLWVDALCIVQDSEEDWLREARKMSDVFSGAVVTIAAADAENHSQGIFRPRAGVCIRPFPMPYLDMRPYCDRTFVDGEGPVYIFPNTGLVSAGARSKGTLDTRGWILQEQLLSPRVLYFDRGEIFWDCMTVSASESSPISTSLLDDKDPDETWALKLVRKTLVASHNSDTLRHRLAEVWTQVIKNYSSRQLSKQSDKLIALDGIAQPLSALLGEPLVAGMWETHMWRQLIWWKARPQPASVSQHQSLFPAPTWSWLGSDGPVFYHTTLISKAHSSSIKAPTATNSSSADLEQHMKILSVNATIRPGTMGVDGYLVVSGPSFRYRLTANDLKKPMTKRLNAGKWNLNAANWLLDRCVEMPVEVHCVIVGEDVVAKMLVCLCLVPHEHTGQWQRVGLCHWDGLTWQVANFAGKELEEMEFTIV